MPTYQTFRGLSACRRQALFSSGRTVSRDRPCCHATKRNATQDTVRIVPLSFRLVELFHAFALVTKVLVEVLIGSL